MILKFVNFSYFIFDMFELELLSSSGHWMKQQGGCSTVPYIEYLEIDTLLRKEQLMTLGRIT